MSKLSENLTEEMLGSAQARQLEDEKFAKVTIVAFEKERVLCAEIFDLDMAERIAGALRAAYGAKPERSDIDLRAFLDVTLGWYGEDDNARPRSKEVMAFFQGRHGLQLPNGNCIPMPYKNHFSGDTVPSKLYASYVPVARRLADNFESLAAQMREILANSDA